MFPLSNLDLIFNQSFVNYENLIHYINLKKKFKTDPSWTLRTVYVGNT